MLVSLICYLKRQRDDGGALHTSSCGRGINEASPARGHHSSSLSSLDQHLLPDKTLHSRAFSMQAPSRAADAFGYSVRNYAPAALCPLGTGGPYTPSTKPPSGKSFTIEALLAKPEEARSPPQSAAAFPHAAPGLPLPPAPFLYSPNMLHSAVHAQPGYSVYCCPAFSYPSSCRGAFYAQAAMSKVSAGLHPFKAKGGKSKRLRTSFTSEQLSRLEKEFARQQYMVGSERFLLASALQLTEAQVKVWFQNRRIKWRKQSLEQQQAKLAKLGLAPPKSPGSQGHEDEEFSDSDVDVSVSEESAEH